MRLIKSIVAMAAAMVASFGYTEDSAPFRLDTKTAPVVNSISVPWDASWIGGDANATVVITDNGTEVRRATGVGEFVLSGIGRHELTYTTYIDGVAQKEIYAVTVFKDWMYDLVNGNAVITKGCQTEGALTIPSEIDGHIVTGIGDYAFYDYVNLTSVTIPSSVTNIGWQAFAGCRGLTAVCIADLVAWCRISFRDRAANPLSNAHDLYLDGELVKDLVIPDCVTNIGWGAFVGCSLTSVTIPDSVTSIGYYAFCGCSGLTSLTIPAGVTNIGGGGV